jgi:hypothetical protein
LRSDWRPRKSKGRALQDCYPSVLQTGLWPPVARVRVWCLPS